MIREHYIERSCAGRAGFPYVLELRMSWHGLDNWQRRVQSWQNLAKNLNRSMGKPYQKHWSRKQLNRRWYYYETDNRKNGRFCFRNERDLLLARMMIQ